MTKVVYNTCYGGFDLSEQVVMLYADLKGIKLFPEVSRSRGYTLFWKSNDVNTRTSSDLFSTSNISRSDTLLIRAIEEVGLVAAAGSFSRLAIVELEKGTLYRIEEHDGKETVKTKTEIDWLVAD